MHVRKFRLQQRLTPSGRLSSLDQSANNETTYYKCSMQTFTGFPFAEKPEIALRLSIPAVRSLACRLNSGPSPAPSSRNDSSFNTLKKTFFLRPPQSPVFCTVSRISRTACVRRRHKQARRNENPVQINSRVSAQVKTHSEQKPNLDLGGEKSKFTVNARSAAAGRRAATLQNREAKMRREN